MIIVSLFLILHLIENVPDLIHFDKGVLFDNAPQIDLSFRFPMINALVSAPVVIVLQQVVLQQRIHDQLRPDLVLIYLFQVILDSFQTFLSLLIQDLIVILDWLVKGWIDGLIVVVMTELRL